MVCFGWFFGHLFPGPKPPGPSLVASFGCSVMWGERGLVKMALSSEHDGIKQDKLGFLPNKAFTRKPWFSFSERIGIFAKTI